MRTSLPSLAPIDEAIDARRVVAALAATTLLFVLAALTQGCAAPPPDTGEATQGGAASEAEQEGDTGDIWDDDAMRMVRGGGGGCARSREDLLAAAGSERRAALERGFTWLDDAVPYSQSRQHDGYRTDCSGFVSMAWQLSQSYTTASFASGSAENHKLASFEALEPGDALVRRSGRSGHIVLFVGWDDEDHTSACVLEQASTRSDMQFGPRAIRSLRSGGYKPVRADAL